MKFFTLLFATLLSNLALAGVTREKICAPEAPQDCIEKVTVAWWGANISGNSVMQVPLFGTLLKVETKPGKTALGGVAPTNAYDIALWGDLDDTNYDVLGRSTVDRSSTSIEAVYPRPTFPGITGGIDGRLVLAGLYHMAISGNSVNNSNGSVIFYMAPKGF